MKTLTLKGNIVVWLVCIISMFIVLAITNNRESSSSSSAESVTECRSRLCTFDDLLDAIEWVESRGNWDAIGDWIETKILPEDYDSESAKDEEDGYIGFQFKPPMVGFNENPVDFEIRNGEVYKKEYQAVGAYQIHKIYVDDCNRILELQGSDNLSLSEEKNENVPLPGIRNNPLILFFFKKSSILSFCLLFFFTIFLSILFDISYKLLSPAV